MPICRDIGRPTFERLWKGAYLPTKLTIISTDLVHEKKILLFLVDWKACLQWKLPESRLEQRTN